MSRVGSCRLSAIVWGGCIRDPILGTMMQSQLSVAVCHAGTDNRIFHHAIFMVLIHLITLETLSCSIFYIIYNTKYFWCSYMVVLIIFCLISSFVNRLSIGLRFMYRDNFCNLRTIIKLFCVVVTNIKLTKLESVCQWANLTH